MNFLNHIVKQKQDEHVKRDHIFAKHLILIVQDLLKLPKQAAKIVADESFINLKDCLCNCISYRCEASIEQETSNLVWQTAAETMLFVLGISPPTIADQLNYLHLSLGSLFLGKSRFFLGDELFEIKFLTSVFTSLLTWSESIDFETSELIAIAETLFELSIFNQRSLYAYKTRNLLKFGQTDAPLWFPKQIVSQKSLSLMTDLALHSSALKMGQVFLETVLKRCYLTINQFSLNNPLQGRKPLDKRTEHDIIIIFDTLEALSPNSNIEHETVENIKTHLKDIILDDWTPQNIRKQAFSTYSLF